MNGMLPLSRTPTGGVFISSSFPEIITQPLYDSTLLSGTIQGDQTVFQQGIGSQLNFAAGFGVPGVGNGCSILNTVTQKTLNWTFFRGQAGRLGTPQTFRIERMNAWFNSDIDQRQLRAIVDNTAWVFQVDDKPYVQVQLRHILGGPAPTGFSGVVAITQINGGPVGSREGLHFPIPIAIPSQHDFQGRIQFDRAINLANPFEAAVSPALNCPVKITFNLYGPLSRAVK